MKAVIRPSAIAERQGPRSALTLLVVPTVALVAYLFGSRIGTGTATDHTRLIVLAGGLAGTMLVWWRPFIAVAMAVASVPMMVVLPPVPYATSIVSAIGMVAAASVAVTILLRGTLRMRWSAPLALGGLFVVWQFASNPTASVGGQDNWLLTYAQLWGLAWLGSRLLTPSRQRFLMYAFVAAAVPSGIAAFAQARVPHTFSYSAGLIRGEGFAGNENVLATYLAVAVVMVAYLQMWERSRAIKALLFFAYPPLFLGVVGTVSRAGFVTLAAALVLVVGLRLARQRLRGVVPATALILLALATVQLYVPEGYWTILRSTVFSQAITENQNLGSRLDQIRAGVEMWKSHPITGVGIGAFPYESQHFVQYKNNVGTVLHSMPFAVLAETGLIGLLLFGGAVAAAAKALASTAFYRGAGKMASIAEFWLVIVVVLTLKSLTASTMQHDKLLWLCLGLAVALRVRQPPEPAIMPRASDA